MVLEIYRAGDGFRWRRTASNGRIVDASSQGYARYREVANNLRTNGLPCPLKWQRLAVSVKRGRDRRWKWVYEQQQAAA